MHVAGGPSAFGRGGRPVHTHMVHGPTPHRRPHTQGRSEWPARPPLTRAILRSACEAEARQGEPCHTDPTWL